jgi:hypothetical protein
MKLTRNLRHLCEGREIFQHRVSEKIINDVKTLSQLRELVANM